MVIAWIWISAHKTAINTLGLFLDKTSFQVNLHLPNMFLTKSADFCWIFQNGGLFVWLETRLLLNSENWWCRINVEVSTFCLILTKKREGSIWFRLNNPKLRCLILTIFTRVLVLGIGKCLLLCCRIIWVTRACLFELCSFQFARMLTDIGQASLWWFAADKVEPRSRLQWIFNSVNKFLILWFIENSLTFFPV